MAILIEIISEKLVDTNRVSKIPIIKPTYTTFLATAFPYALLAKSVIRKVIEDVEQITMGQQKYYQILYRVKLIDIESSVE